MNDRLRHLMQVFKGRGFDNPMVYLFKKEDKSLFDECQALLKDNGFTLVDVNQAAVIDPEDYNMPITKAGFSGPTGKETINDCLVSDEEKRNLIIDAKTISIERELNEKAVLVVKYGEQILKNESLYETVRRWLKDGVRPLRSIRAIVYLETTEKIRDFCLYGMLI